jgi:hypothetical protein
MHLAAPQKDDTPTPEQATQEVRGPELGPALKRDRILQRVRAASRRLTPPGGTSDRLR